MAEHKHTEKSLLAAQTGGDGFNLAAETHFTEETYGGLAMNIDFLDDITGTTFEILKGRDRFGVEIDLLEVGPAPYALGKMGVIGKAQSINIRNFTWGMGFTEIKADKDIFINRVNNI